MSLRLKAIAALEQRGEPITYRDLIELLWTIHPELKEHLVQHYQSEQKARREMRMRLGMLVKDYPQTFSATMSDGLVLVGLAADTSAALDDGDSEDEKSSQDGGKAAVYWYTFPAYRSSNGPFPIKVGRGAHPLSRIRTQDDRNAGATGHPGRLRS